ncbi:MAG: hypothetical protein ACXW27_07325 [Allosphingosinicella sp.]
MIAHINVRERLVAHWFVPVFALILGALWLAARDSTFMAEGGEAAILADLCLTAPILYVFCYRRRHSALQLGLRALALACLGIWLGSWVIPESDQSLLTQLGPLRVAGLIVLALVELRLLVAMIRLVFGPETSAGEVSRVTGAPPFVAKLMLLEARFWKAAWRLIRRR